MDSSQVFSPPGSSFDDGSSSFSEFDRATHSISAAAIASIIVGVIATIAIVIAIIYCLKKTGDAMPAYAANAHFSVGVNTAPNHNQVQAYGKFPDVTKASMERFLSDIAREKPIRFTSQELDYITAKYSKVLGSGGFGVVYKGTFPNGVQVAVKLLNDNTSTKRIEEQFMAEVATIGRTYHINLVKLFGFCFESTTRALVYEFMEKGSLDTFLFGDQKGSIEWTKLHEIAIGTARGIAYLHEECEQRIIHYDIKPGNVLLDSNLNPKVADFGLAKLCNRDSTHIVMSGCRGTPGYAAPELWTPYPVTHKCDVYSFGMLLFEILGRRRNHDAQMSETSQEWMPRWAYDRFNKGEVKELLSLVGIVEVEEREKAERMVKVALWCVQYLPKARPGMSSVVKMLEGGVAIDHPPNPFEHLEDNLGSLSSGGHGSSSDPYSSSKRTQTKSALNQPSQNNNLEIQIASSTI